MRLFLQIDAGDWKRRGYDNILVPYASSLADDLMGTDIDNESESTVIDLVIRLIEQAESTFVFISVMSEAGLGSADKVMRFLFQNKSKTNYIIILGEHEIIEKSILNFGGQFLQAKNHEEVKNLIHNFAKKISMPDQTAGLAP